MEMGTWQLPTEDLEGMARTALRVFADVLERSHGQEAVDSPTVFALDLHMICKELRNRRKNNAPGQ